MTVSIKTAKGINYYASAISELFEYGNEAGREGSNDAPGKWGGKFAEAMELEGTAKVKEMAHLFCGFDPREPWPENKPKGLTQNAKIENLEFAILSIDRMDAEKALDLDPQNAAARKVMEQTQERFDELREKIRGAENLRKDRSKLSKEIGKLKGAGEWDKVEEATSKLYRLDMQLKDAPGGNRGAIDICFSVPKSVSLLKESAKSDEERAAIADAIRRATDRTANSLFDRCAVSRMGKKGEIVKAAGVAFITFEHASARPTKDAPVPEPDTHAHKLLFNPVLCEDGETRALFSDFINENRLAADAELMANLAAELKGLGYKTVVEQVGESTSIRVCGITREQELDHSPRRAEILAKLAELEGRGEKANAQIAKLDTRQAKDTFSIRELRAHWQPTLESEGITPENCRKAEAEVGEFKPRSDADIVEDLLGKEAYFTMANLRRELWIDAAITGDVEKVEGRLNDILKSPEFIQLEGEQKKLAALSIGRDQFGEPIFVSKKMAARELALQGKIEELAGKTRWAEITNAAEIVEKIERQNTAEMRAKGKSGEFKFREDQRQMIAATVAGGQVFFCQAYAGTGKTTSANATLEIYKAAGYKTLGLAPSNKATGQLAEDTKLVKGESAMTVAKLLIDVCPTEREAAKYPRPKTPPVVDAKTVILIDEASMISFTQAERLIALAEKTGAKLIFQGDREQLPSVAKGRFFANAVERLSQGAATLCPAFATLEVITRQREEWAKENTLAAAEGRFAEVVEELDKRGCVKLEGTRAALIERLAKDHVEDPSHISEKLVVASTNADVQAVNASIRRRLVEAGKLSGGEHAVVQVGGEKKVLEIADGERIVFMQKVVKGKGKGKKELASKSELGSVIDVQKLPDGHLKMLVMVDGKKGPPIEISTKDAEVEHGYAITVHKSQGATVDSCRYLYSQFTSSELAYVALSRHRQTCEVYAEAEHRESMALKMGRKIAKVETLDLLTEEQRQDLESANEKALGASLFEKVLKKITFKEDLAAKIKKEGEEFYQKLIRPVRYTEAALEKVRAETREIYKNFADALKAPKCQEGLKKLRAAVALAKVERARNKEDAKFIASDLAASEERLKRPKQGLTSNEAMDVLEALDVLKEIRKGEGKDNWRPEIQDTKPGTKASGVVLAANDKYVFLSSIGFRQGLEGMGQNVGGLAFKRVPLAGEKAKAFRQDPSQLKRQIGRAATFELDAKGELAASSITASAEEAKRAELARARAQGQGYGLGR
jgi:conjugative relaxase-like TrwC/TraI family protein